MQSYQVAAYVKIKTLGMKELGLKWSISTPLFFGGKEGYGDVENVWFGGGK